MKKLEEIQARKLISAYGGSGSIIETKDNGSLLILPYDQWNCFSWKELGHRNPVTDYRLLRKIRTIFPGVTQLLSVPVDDLSKRVYCANNHDTNRTIKSQYFPEWFYCPKCRRLHRYDDWAILWERQFNNDQSFRRNYPACYRDSTRIGNRFRRYPLQQIRFVMASLDNGKMIDIPFDILWNVQFNNNCGMLDNATAVPEELYYKTSQGGDGLQSIFIQRGTNGPRLRLTTIYRNYLVYQNGLNRGAYRVAVRNGNNLYYPNIIKSIYIPNDFVSDVLKRCALGDDENAIFAAIGDRYHVTLQQIQDVIAGRDFINLEADEYVYFTNPSHYRNNTNRKRDFYAVKYPKMSFPFIRGFYALRRLKETSVLTSFCRISSSRKLWYDVATNSEQNIDPHYVIPYSRQDPNFVNFVPAIEEYGEGLFFDIDVQNIDINDREAFVHTFCHLIMKELEFQCGYPVTSLKEKIYIINRAQQFGFLIYTIAGSEGSYGGLVSLMPTDSNAQTQNSKIISIITIAIERAKNCTNDPICEHEGGHCFACLDLPETSCQYWNKHLNRNVFNRYMCTATINTEMANSNIEDNSEQMPEMCDDSNNITNDGNATNLSSNFDVIILDA